MTITLKNRPALTLVDGANSTPPDEVKKKGRPKWEPDLEKVEELASQGLTKEQISTALGVAKSTFHEQQANYSDFSDAVKRGKAKGIAKVSSVAFEMATSGKCFPATKFWLQAQAGWREKEAYTFEAIEDKSGCDVEGVLSSIAHALMKSGAVLNKQGEEGLFKDS